MSGNTKHFLAAAVHAGVAAVAALLALSCRQAAAGPFSLGEHALGTRLDTVLADPRFDCNGLAGCFLFEACTLRDGDQGRFRDVPVEGLTLYFTGERLAGIEARFPESEFRRVLASLEQAYGDGETAEGGSAENTVRVWRNGSRLLRIERLPRPAYSSVILAERHLMGELTRR